MRKSITKYLLILGIIYLTGCNALYTGSMIFIKPGKRKNPHVENTLDYAETSSWYVHPDKPNDAADGDFLNVKDNQANAKAAVFYIHPTSYFSSKSWNKPVDSVTKDRFLESTVLPNQLTVFIESYEVYAPKYPQATLAAFLSKDTDGFNALSLASTHLEKAFDFFLSEIGDRPFIIAGHSQGSYHVVSLLSTAIVGSGIESRLITALAPGYPFPLDYLEDRNISLCTTGDQLGCLETWNVLKYNSDFINRLNKGPLPNTARRISAEDRLAVTNPIEPDKKYSPKSRNRGSYLGGFKSPDTPFVSNLIEADVDSVRGVIRIEKPSDKRFRKMLMGPGWYHQYEYSFYFLNIKDRMNQKLKHYKSTYYEN